MNEHVTRRGFLVKVGRAASFAGLGALVARLAGRAVREGPSRRTDLCGQCHALARCNFPEAEDARRMLRQPKQVPAGDGGLVAEVRGLCGVRPEGAPLTRWLGARRKVEGPRLKAEG